MTLHPLPPRYSGIYDCSSCRYVGRVGRYDIAVCEAARSAGLTYIARYGPGSEYSSMQDFGNRVRGQVAAGTGSYPRAEMDLDIIVTFRLMPSLLLNEWAEATFTELTPAKCAGCGHAVHTEECREFDGPFSRDYCGCLRGVAKRQSGWKVKWYDSRISPRMVHTEPIIVRGSYADAVRQAIGWWEEKNNPHVRFDIVQNIVERR